VQLGLTDDSFILDFPLGMTWESFTSSFLPPAEGDVRLRLKNYLNISNEILKKLDWLGIFENSPIGDSAGSPAQVLQRLIEQRWVLEKNDIDMIVMWHRFRYRLNDWTTYSHCSKTHSSRNMEFTRRSSANKRRGI
jgi:hypothetical protein